MINTAAASFRFGPLLGKHVGALVR